jgi:hypothetical protein
MMMVVMLGHECERGIVEVGSAGWGQARVKDTSHTRTHTSQRKHNETYQKLLENGGRKKWEYNGESELVQSTLYSCLE